MKSQHRYKWRLQRRKTMQWNRNDILNYNSRTLSLSKNTRRPESTYYKRQLSTCKTDIERPILKLILVNYLNLKLKKYPGLPKNNNLQRQENLASYFFKINNVKQGKNEVVFVRRSREESIRQWILNSLVLLLSIRTTELEFKLARTQWKLYPWALLIDECPPRND